MIQLRIKDICNEKGITRNVLTEKAGVSQPSISGIATGKQKPSFDTLEKLSEALGIPLPNSLNNLNQIPVASPAPIVVKISTSKKRVWINYN